MVLPMPLTFDAQVCRSEFEPKLLEVASRGLVPVVTAERLSGNPHSGGYDCKELADRLHDVFPDSRVFIVIREQIGMILSSYKQYVRVGGTASLNDYLDPPFYRRSRGLRMPLFRFEYFEYHWLIEYYRELFGSDNVLVLPFEQFSREPKDFTRRIMEFAEADGLQSLDSLPYSKSVNSALTAGTVAMKRRSNVVATQDSVNPWAALPNSRVKRAVDGTVQLLDKLVPSGVQKSLDAKMKKQVQDSVGHRYCASNQRVAEITGLDLKKWGYDL
jgi:hypothetical protein